MLNTFVPVSVAMDEFQAHMATGKEIKLKVVLLYKFLLILNLIDLCINVRHGHDHEHNVFKVQAS